jgi:hypothetical protein
MFMCVVNQKSVNQLDLTWKQSFLYWWTANFSDDAPCTSLIDFSEETTNKPTLHATFKTFNTVNILT